MLIAKSNPPWLTLEGIALIVLGIAAVILPIAAGVAAALVFGWLLFFSGGLGLFFAYQGRSRGHFGWDIASAIIALLIGALLVVFPIFGAAALVWLLGVYLFLDGFSLLGLAFSHKRRGLTKWRWLLAAGALDVVLALIILILNVAASAFLLGLVVGVDLIFAGVAVLSAHRVMESGPLVGRSAPRI